VTESVEVTVALAPQLHATAGTETRERVEEELAGFLRELGVSRRPVVALEPDDPSEGSSVPVRVLVDGHACRFPKETIDATLSYVMETPCAIHVEGIEDLVAQVANGPRNDRGSAQDEFIAFVCREAIANQPSVLATGDDTRSPLDLGMRPAQGERADGSEGDADAARERLLAASRASAIEVLIDPSHLHALTNDRDEIGEFDFMRDGLFVELGLELPSFEFHPDPSLRPGGFAFRFNARRTAPHVGLADGTALVNDTPDRLKLMNIAAMPAANPATRQPAAVVTSSEAEALEAAGLTTWTPLGYLILTFAVEVRRHAHALMTLDVSAAMVTRLGMAVPVTESVAQRHAPPEVLTPILRELLADGVSIRNLQLIIERLAKHQTAGDEVRSLDRLRFVRASLADAIAFKFGRGTETLVTYILDPDLEQAVAARHADAEPFWPQDAVAARLCAAVRSEQSHLPPTAQRPVILTRDDVRLPVRRALRVELPDIVVVGYSDIPPEFNVQPVARIGWSD
jgi:type III secretory pathway component EscV